MTFDHDANCVSCHAATRVLKEKVQSSATTGATMKRLLAFAFCLVLGCGAKVPPLSSESQLMVRKFEDHMPRHKTQTFESLNKDLEKLHDSKKITDEEYQVLHKVCEPASKGQWDRATTALEPLLKAPEAKKQ